MREEREERKGQKMNLIKKGVAVRQREYQRNREPERPTEQSETKRNQKIVICRT